MIDLVAYGAFFLTTALIYALMSLGLNLQWGQTGLFNVGIAGFVAIGAYTSAILTTPPMPGRFGGFDLPIVVGFAAAMAMAGISAGFIGLVTLRLRTDYLAITTFGVAVTVELAALNLQGLTGGPFGISFIPRQFGWLQAEPLAFDLANLALVGAVTLVVFVGLERLVRSPWGRVLRALREDERAAVSLGKSSGAYRVQAFAIGGAVMGLAGAVQAHFIGFIAPENYLSTLTFQVWAMLIVGGSGNNRGAVLGSLLVWAIWAGSGSLTAALLPPEAQARAASLQIVAIGLILCAILLLRPRGLLSEERLVSRHIDASAEELASDG